MAHLLDLPALQDQQHNPIQSKNLLLLDHDTKFMVLGEEGSVFKYDITRG